MANPQDQKQQNRPQQPQTEGISERQQPDRDNRTQPDRQEGDPLENYRERADSGTKQQR